MYILGFSVSAKETYISMFNTVEKSVVTEKYIISNDNGGSLRELYNYLHMFISRQRDITKIVMEIASMGQRGPSIERVKSEGIIDLVINDLNLSEDLLKIKTQKTKKKYKELPENPLWESLNKTKYSSKIQQVIAYLLIEEML